MKEYYNKSVDEVLQELKVGENGLADLQVDNMRMQFGENKLKEVKKPSPIMVFVSQFNDFLI